MPLELRLNVGQYVKMDDVAFVVLKKTELRLVSECDLTVYNPDGSIRHHLPKRD